ncbi:hypothetical protein [Nocardia wallacei]|uniref:hypothetical protein n=1 Tax=Nocardia wallacei TaxID=480035 RepID=UPI002457FD3A|nr:hypothetical protein [Nocardia wallacei]
MNNDNVSRLPVRPDAVQQRVAEQAATAVRDYLHARRQLDQQLARLEESLRDGAAGQVGGDTATALNESLTAVAGRVARLRTLIEIAHTTGHTFEVNASIAEAATPHEPEPPPRPATASRSALAGSGEPAWLSGVADLAALGADSIVIQQVNALSGRPRPYQRGDDGLWYTYGITTAGITSDGLWRSGEGFTVAFHSDRPATAGANEYQRVAADAAWRGWRTRDAGPGRLTLERSGVVIDLRYSTSKGNITKASRTLPSGTIERTAAVGKVGMVLRWLAEPS